MRAIAAFVICAALSVVVNCTTQTVPPAGVEISQEKREKVVAEAYLFDAKLRREGKVNSFRLEIFQTDSIMGLAGRGYLGKGALKGWVKPDSLKVYFPTAHEYLYKSVGELFGSFECTSDLPEIDLLGLFSALPDSAELDSRVVIDADYSNDERPVFLLSVSGCPWRIEITYDRRDPGWRIREFSFDDGNTNELSARRREYRDEARVKPIVFEAAIPMDAIRIYP